jgi:stage V sporulation protein G
MSENKIEITEVNIFPIKPNKGLVGFASLIINNQFFVGNIAIYTLRDSSKGYRLVYPNKKMKNGTFTDCFFPINKEAGSILYEAIILEYIQQMII